MAASNSELQQLLLHYIGPKGKGRERMREVLQTTSVEVKYNSLMSVRGENRYTALHRASVLGDMDSLKCMMVGFTPEQWFNTMKMQTDCDLVFIIDKRTALHLAASKGYTNIIMFLLSNLSQEQRFNILKTQDDCGSIPLHLAASNKHTVALQMMLASVSPDQQKKLLNIRDDEGKSTADISPIPELPYDVAGWTRLELDVTNQKLAEVQIQQKATIDELKADLVKQGEDNAKNMQQQTQELGNAKQKVLELEAVVDKQRMENVQLNKELRSLIDRQEKMENMMEEMERLLRQPICIGPEMDQEHEG